MRDDNIYVEETIQDITFVRCFADAPVIEESAEQFEMDM